jgi:hypothetical protein
MQKRAVSYFRPDGSFRATMILFVPDGDEKLHEDGISIIRADGTVFRQVNPYTTKERYTKESLVEVEGELSGHWTLTDGKPELLPEPDRPGFMPNAAEIEMEAMRAKLTAADLDAARARLVAARATTEQQQR